MVWMMWELSLVLEFDSAGVFYVCLFKFAIWADGYCLTYS